MWPISAHATSGQDLLNYCAEFVRKWGAVPQEVKIEQVIRVIEKYLRENPAMLHLHAVSLSSVALNTAFPCKR
jgi:hypothetical protein